MYDKGELFMILCSFLIFLEVGRIFLLLILFLFDCKVVIKILNDKMLVIKVLRFGKRKGGVGVEVGFFMMGFIDIMVW